MILLILVTLHVVKLIAQILLSTLEITKYFVNINWWPVKRLLYLLEYGGSLAVEFKIERFQFLVKILSKESFCKV